MMPRRTWLTQRSRDISFLWKCAVGLVGAALLLAGLLQTVREEHDGPADIVKLVVKMEEGQHTAEKQYQKLCRMDQPHPAQLAEWIRSLAEVMEKKSSSPPWAFDPEALRLGEMDLRALQEKHVHDPVQRDLFAQFSRSWIMAPGAAREEEARFVHEAVAIEPPLRFASEFDGDLFMRDNKRAESLAAYMREGTLEDAVRARSMAMHVALLLEDKEAVRKLCADPRYVRETSPSLLLKAGRLVGDRWLMVRSKLRQFWRHWSQSGMVPLALFAAAVWYVILVQSASRERLRWLRYLSPVAAGVMSVWLLEWWQLYLHHDLSNDGSKSPLEEALGWIMYVGVPEEAAKLCLFAVFVPLLLKHGSSSKAALTAGCVGLGFALHENLLYYEGGGASAAVTRLVTANFMHIAMTGLIGLWFYGMARSRFHRAGEFLTVFAGVATAHGLYDFATTASALEMGVDLAGIIILAVLARMYLQHLKPPLLPGPRPVISSTAVFFLGLAIVVAVAIVMAVWQANTMKAAILVLKQTLAIIPVAVLFVREFREV